MGSGWASVGVARSTDYGHTWPAPTANPGYENNWLDYGNGRYAGVTLPGTPLTTTYSHFYGDALPSAFVDDVHPEKGYYVYVPYTFTGTPTTNGDAHIHIARARLGRPGKLTFEKWYVDPNTNQGGWTEAGIGGNESGLLQMPSCAPAFANQVAQITYNEAYGVYMMTYACLQLTKSGTKWITTNGSWYYATATDLEKQDWSPPQPIAGSSYPVPYGTQPWEQLDGGYPSFMSPGCKSGHIGSSGTAFFLKGDGLGWRTFASRTFTISGADPNLEACRSYRP
jgi:hypothetical protein